MSHKNNKGSRYLLPLLGCWLLAAPLQAEVRLPKLISDGMVLQRGTGIKIWGWADPGEKVTVHFDSAQFPTRADGNGNWQVALPETPAGGPYRMQIEGDNRIELQDILFGDVWICSGQSNMELNMSRVSPKYPQDIAAADKPDIRQFYVPRRYDFNTPQRDLESGHWQLANPETVLEFSAVGYFFADALHRKHRVPIGLINSSLGGSPAEAWLSEEALKKFPGQYAELQQFKDGALIERIKRQDEARISDWHAQANARDAGLRENWYSTQLQTEDWQQMTVPGYWNTTKLGDTNGAVWFRKIFQVPADMAGQAANLELGRIVDADTTYVNGREVGATAYQYPPRRYAIPAGLLKAGKNTIAVRVVSEHSLGGFVPDKPYEIVSGNRRIDLRGDWQFKLGTPLPELESQTFIRWKPTGLYNAMLHPLMDTAIKGVIWYQGESNVSRAEEYKKIFPAMIADWRSNWQQGDFPFLYVQLANFLEPSKSPQESDWARLREAQRQTLKVPRTAMAVAIDIGEWNDIHPLDKKTVGERLALAAEKVAYGNDSAVYSGPQFAQLKASGNELLVEFSHTGGGLMTRNGEAPRAFAIAGEDGRYVWAAAKIRGNQVAVWSDSVNAPVSVRYAWADNPTEANLYNNSGLPASPFEASLTEKQRTGSAK